jgi:hypothetical protein
MVGFMGVVIPRSPLAIARHAITISRLGLMKQIAFSPTDKNDRTQPHLQKRSHYQINSLCKVP